MLESEQAVTATASRSGRWVLATTIVGSAMAFFDGSGVNVAMPVIQREFSADTAAMQWMVEVYALLLAAFTLIGGSLGDQYGRRRCYAVGIVLFATASLACALASGANALIAARMLQGVGGALLLPGGLAIIGAYFPAGERGRAIGTWAAFGGIAGMLAPLLAGYLTQFHSWRWIFYLNLPLAIVTLFLLYRSVPESRDEMRSRQVDWAGGLLAGGGLAALVFGLIEYPRLGAADPLVAGSLSAAALILMLFVLVEARAPAPMLPLALLRQRLFAGINLATLLLYTGLNGLMFFLPFNLIHVLGFSPSMTGLAFVPISLLIFLLSRWTGGLASRNPRLPLVVGPTIVACAYLALAQSDAGDSSRIGLIGGMLLLGIGMGFCIAPITEVAIGAVPRHRAGIASGFNNTMARVASVLAVALFGVVITTNFDRQLDARLDTLDASAATRDYFAVERGKLAAAEPPTGLSLFESTRLREAIKESFSAGFRWVCYLASGLAFATAICCWIVLRPIKGDPRSISATSQKINL